ncbi:MAG: sporulation integral membrane protein YtvI [Paenibacillaceae bacterium]
MSLKLVVFVVVGLLALYGLFTVGFPFLLALIIAIFLEPLVQLFMKIPRLSRIAAATMVCSLFTIVMLGLMYLIGLKVISEFLAFLKKLPNYLTDANMLIQETVVDLQKQYDELPDDVVSQIQDGTSSGIGALIDSLNSLLGTISGSFFALAKAIPNLFIFFIVFIVALYLTSYSLTTLKGAFLSLFEEKSRDKVSEVLLNLRNAIFGFIRAQVIISFLTYIVALIGLLILDVNFALAVALLIIIVDILPILGTGSVLVPWAIYTIVIGNDTFQGIGLIVLFLVITVFRRMIEPKILGDSIGIGALSTLISLYVGFKLVGVVGLFLGPIVIIIYVALKKVGLLRVKIKLE